MANILICTLTEQRDSVVDERIASSLRKLGHDVSVRNYVMAGNEAVLIEKPDVVVLPMIGSLQKLDFAKKCHEWGILVVARRGEAGATKDVLAQMDRERVKVVVGDYDYEPYVDLELVWGPEFADILADRKRMDRKKIVPCGAFILDACFDHAMTKVPGKRRVLFATAWNGADDDPQLTECGLPLNSPFQSQMYSAHRKGRDTWIQTIKGLVATKSHKYEFTLKVRPGESLSEYRAKLPKSVKILPYDFPSSDAIAMSDVVVHAGSTMAVEAHLMGIPSINFTNINPDPRLANICPQAGDFGQLVDLLARVPHGQSNADHCGIQWLFDHLYGMVDGQACNRAASAIHEAYTQANKGRGKRAKPRIPDHWPTVVEYPTPDVVTERTPGFRMGICVACKNRIAIKEGATVVFCPYCGMTMHMVIVPTSTGK